MFAVSKRVGNRRNYQTKIFELLDTRGVADFTLVGGPEKTEIDSDSGLPEVSEGREMSR